MKRIKESCQILEEDCEEEDPEDEKAALLKAKEASKNFIRSPKNNLNIGGAGIYSSMKKSS